MGIIEKIKKLFRKNYTFDENKKTVFDYDITDEEWNNIGGCMDKSFYLKYATQDDFNQDIATLFWLRGEKEKAKKFAERLPLNDRNDWLRLMTHP